MPAVNVKIHGSGYQVNDRAWRDWAIQAKYAHTDPRFTADWLESHLTGDDRAGWWEDAIAGAWAQLQNDYDAHQDRFWGPAIITGEGRSSGWAVVYRTRAGESDPYQSARPMFQAEDVATWDAIDLAKWARFAKWARQTADDVPYQWLALIYQFAFLPWAEAQQEQAIAAHVAEALNT